MSGGVSTEPVMWAKFDTDRKVYVRQRELLHKLYQSLSDISGTFEEPEPLIITYMKAIEARWEWVCFSCLEGLCIHSLPLKVKDMVYDVRQSMCERGSIISIAEFPPKDSGIQCETEQSALPWDKYRLDIARGSLVEKTNRCWD